MLTYIGFIFFNDTVLTMMVAFGLILSFMGAGSYALDSYLKEREKKNVAKKGNKLD